jgi:cadmium resistance protein CadD (predicted permease)
LITNIGYLIILGISSFVSTNIDDIFLLIVFFSNVLRYPSYQVVIGQYVGIGLLVTISIIFSLVSLVIPSFLVGLMGFVPIVIGIKKLLEKHNKEKLMRIDSNTNSFKNKNQNKSTSSLLPFVSVAAVTVSNGGDNLGIYTPLFAVYNSIDQFIIFIAIFMIMTALWCSIGFYLVNHSFLANRIQYIGHIVLPFVLIGLGLYIIIDHFIIEV